MKRFLSAIVLLASCAGVGGVSERSYTRDDLKHLELRSIDVLVVAKGPPLAAGELLQITPFEAPSGDQPVGVAREDAVMRDALAAALRTDLSARGFAVRVVGAPERAQPLEPAALPSIQTSTTVMSSTAAEVRPLAPPPPAPQPPLFPADATLEQLRLASQADGLLVVRTVIVDELHLHEPARTSATQLPGDIGPVRSEPGRSYPVRGRLLIGQAFLFDRRTGLRLWSRQLPDFPEGGKVLEKHPILAYGFVQADKAALDEEKKAELAAPRFVSAMLREFPRAQEGDPEVRAKLDAVDVEAELREARFFDDSRVLIGLDVGYAAESSGSDLTLDGVPLPSLGTGAVSPNGIPRGGVRVGYLAPSGFVFSLAGQFGYAPSSFSRVYHRDRDVEAPQGDRDRNAQVTIDGANTYGAELGVGYLILLTRDLMLVPAANVFSDIWTLRAEPAEVVDRRTHVRVGLDLDLDLLLSITPAWFTRFGIGVRGGFDTGGPVFGGAGVSLGLGVFL